MPYLNLRRPGRPPLGPYRLNSSSEQAKGLVFWVPLLGPDNSVDRVRGVTLSQVNGTSPYIGSSMGLVRDFNIDAVLEHASYSPPVNYPFTMMGWMNLDATGIRGLVSLGEYHTGNNYFALRTAAGPLACFTARTTSANNLTIASPTLSANRWYHLAGIAYGSASRKVVLDGSLTATTTNSKAVSGVTSVAIGGTPLGSTPFYENLMNGQIFDVRVYSRNVEPEEFAEWLSPQARYDLFAPARHTYVISIPWSGAAETNLVIQEAAHAHAADNLALTQVHSLVVQDATHSHAADNLSLTQVHILVVQEAGHAHAADNLGLTQTHVLTVQEASHGHTADNLDLTQSHNLSIQEAAHAHIVDNLDLTQVHILVVQEAGHSHISDNLDLTTATDLVVQESAHAHSADNVVLTQVHSLVVQEASHGHATDSPGPTQVHNLRQFNNLLDNFNRTDENPVNTNWDGPIFTDPYHGQFQLIGNQLAPRDANGSNSYWNTSFGADQYCSITYATMETGNASNWGLFTRIQNPNQGTLKYYLAYFEPSDGRLSIWRGDADASNTKLAETTHTFSAGYKYRLSSIGNTHTIEVDRGSGWEQLLQTTDATYYVGGYVGIYSDRSTEPRFDDFYGGVLAGFDSSHGHTADSPVLEHVHVLAVQDTSHGHAADNLNLIVDLVVQEATHGHAADNLNLVVDLVVQESLHGHTADNVILETSATLEIQESGHAHVSDNLDLTQEHVLVIGEAAHAHVVDNIVLTQEHVLAISDGSHGHTADNLVLTQEQVLVIGDSTHAHIADNLNLIVDLAITDSQHSHIADNLGLTQVHILVIEDCVHGHSADNLVLIAALSIQDAHHAQFSDNLVMEQVHILGVQESDHLHTADNINLVVDLAIQEAAHAHAADSLNLIVDLTIQEATHGHAADNLNLIVDLSIQESAHSHAAEVPTLEVIHNLDISESGHWHTSDNILIFQDHTITIADATHGHTSDPVTHVLNQEFIPDGDIALGTWEDELGGTTNIYQSINEDLPVDADYITALAGAATSYTCSLSDNSDPLVSTDHIVYYRYGKSGEGVANLTVKLKEGTTTIASWSHNNIGVGPIDAMQVLSGAEADSITDYMALRLEFEAS